MIAMDILARESYRFRGVKGNGFTIPRILDKYCLVELNFRRGKLRVGPDPQPGSQLAKFNALLVIVLRLKSYIAPPFEALGVVRGLEGSPDGAIPILPDDCRRHRHGLDLLHYIQQ